MSLSDARLSLVTLGVADLARAGAFYEALGWRRAPIEAEGVVFLQGEGIALSLFGTDELAHDAGLDAAPLPAFRGIALAINLASRADVDRLFTSALTAGARATKPPEPASWGGYSGYFADPDGHLWELAHNPFFAFDASGHLDLLTPPEPSEEPA